MADTSSTRKGPRGPEQFGPGPQGPSIDIQSILSTMQAAEDVHHNINNNSSVTAGSSNSSNASVMANASSDSNTSEAVDYDYLVTLEPEDADQYFTDDSAIVNVEGRKSSVTIKRDKYLHDHSVYVAMGQYRERIQEQRESIISQRYFAVETNLDQFVQLLRETDGTQESPAIINSDKLGADVDGCLYSWQQLLAMVDVQ